MTTFVSFLTDGIVDAEVPHLEWWERTFLSFLFNKVSATGNNWWQQLPFFFLKTPLHSGWRKGGADTGVTGFHRFWSNSCGFQNINTNILKTKNRQTRSDQPQSSEAPGSTSCLIKLISIHKSWKLNLKSPSLSWASRFTCFFCSTSAVRVPQTRPRAPVWRRRESHGRHRWRQRRGGVPPTSSPWCVARARLHRAAALAGPPRRQSQ